MERPNGTPTLRPRAARRKSLDNDVNASTASTASASGSSTPALRITSPIPRSHPSRPAAGPAPKALRDASAAVSDIWGTSWTALQGLASNVLGNEADTASRRSRPPWAQRRRTSTSAPPTQWGPSAPAGPRVGMGSQEERESKVRELKRRNLLNAAGDTRPDAAGRMKRRNSDDRASFSAVPGEDEESDALVYIHHVRKEDTLAGITIKFNCTPAVLRKANRMWPNDSIQTKKVVVLPVDACGVKGRPAPAPDSALEETSQQRLQPLTESASLDPYKPQSRENRLTPTVSHSSVDSEPPWKHESWVLLPNDSKPTEIGRMPRRTLGFFPPARRKSVTFSDASPPASLDLPRSSMSTDHAGSHAASPKQPAGRGRPAAARTSSMSMARGRGRSGSNKFLLHGPGGVGTLDKNTKSPGPAPDGLYKLLAPHLPSVEPPPDQEYFTPWAPSLLEAGSGTSTQHATSGARTPLGPGLDLQELGGAIEGWIRKVGSQASKILSEPNTPGQGKRSAVPVIGTVGGDIGDLIELRDDAFESPSIQGPGARSPGRNMPRESRATQLPRLGSDFTLSLRERARKEPDGKKAG